MGVPFGDNIAYQGTLPNFERDAYETIAAMKAMKDARLPKVFLGVCYEDGNVYKYTKTNEVDPVTGKWRLFSAGGDPIQVVSLPSAVSTLKGKIFQFVGETDSTYTNGYFYQCAEIDTDTYAWVQKNVQPGGGGSSVQADWTQDNPSAPDYIQHKPTLGTAAAKNSTSQVTENSSDLVESGAVHDAIASAISRVYTPGGDKQGDEYVAALLVAANLGKVYNTTTAGTTTSDFVGGADKPINVGANVAIVNVGTDAEPSYKFDVLSGFVDLTPYQTKSLVTPITVEGQEQTTVEGALNAINNKSSGGGPAELSESVTASVAVGGVTVGKQYAAGTSLETVIKDMIDPVQNPSLTNPSVTLGRSPSSLLIETNGSKSVTFTANFNRGSISPAYGTSGYRSGPATDYALNDEAAQSENTWTKTVDKDHKTYKVTANYSAGEQPKNSKGGNYSSPLPAGSVESASVTFEFVNALWANTSNIATVAKLALVSKSTKQYEFNFPAATIANPEVFEVPASWTVTAIEYYDEVFTHAWSDCSSEFSTTAVTEKDGGNVDTDYVRYTCNLGAAMGARKIRVKWS